MRFQHLNIFQIFSLAVFFLCGCPTPDGETPLETSDGGGADAGAGTRTDDAGTQATDAGTATADAGTGSGNNDGGDGDCRLLASCIGAKPR